MRDTQFYKVLEEKAANGIGANIFTKYYKIAILSLNTTNNASATIKIQISQQEELPDFTSAATKTNQWTYAQIINLTDGSALDGTTGIVLTGTDVAGNQYEINTNGQKWVNAIVSSYSAGKINLDIQLYDNQ